MFNEFFLANFLSTQVSTPLKVAAMKLKSINLTHHANHGTELGRVPLLLADVGTAQYRFPQYLEIENREQGWRKVEKLGMASCP